MDTLVWPQMLDYNLEATWSDLCLVICLFIGLVKLLRISLRLMLPFTWSRIDLQSKFGGGWAVVTGGSEGIGLALCEELAKEGFHICIISRSETKLNSAQLRIRKLQPNIQVKTVSFDFTRLADSSNCQQLWQQLSGLDISILVNNVGAYYPGRFTESSVDKLYFEQCVNIMPITIMTRLLLPVMNSRPKAGAVINLSSGSATAVFTGCCNYSATKVFDDVLSKSVASENTKLTFISVKPFLITSAMTYFTTGLLYCEPGQCARKVIDDLSHAETTFGHWFHRLQGVMMEELPSVVSRHIMSMAMKQNQLIYDQKKDK